MSESAFPFQFHHSKYLLRASQAKTALSILNVFIYLTIHSYPYVTPTKQTVVILLLEVCKWRHREAKALAKGFPATK